MLECKSFLFPSSGGCYVTACHNTSGLWLESRSDVTSTWEFKTFDVSALATAAGGPVTKDSPTPSAGRAEKKAEEMTVALSLIFFLSGAAALIFEYLWFQFAGLVFGNSVYAASIVLASFMAGIALGNTLVAFRGDGVKRPIRLYAFLETLVAVSGFSLVLVLPHLTSLLAPVFTLLLERPWLLNLLRAIISILLMLVPTTAMGATLPLLVKALYSKDTNYGKVLGLLYGLNTLGAVFGVLAGEVLLVRLFGLRGTGLIASALLVCSAVVAFLLSRKFEPGRTAAKKARQPKLSSPFSSRAARLLIVSFFCGFLLLSLEVVWFRFMMLFFNATSFHFVIMLAVVLAGISIGGLFAAKLFAWRPDSDKNVVSPLCINGVLLVLLYHGFRSVFSSVSRYGEYPGIFLASLFLMFPVAFFSGMVFTMLGRALHKELGTEIKATGLLTLANTIGGACGSLVSGLVLIPVVGVEGSFFLFALVYGASAVLLVAEGGHHESKLARALPYTGLAVVTISLFTFPFGLMKHALLNIATARYIEANGERRVAVREGINETIQYLEKDLWGRPHYYRLITNSHPMSSTELRPKRYMKMFVYLPVAIHNDVKNALLICYGAGMTAKALTDTKTIERIDIVDISRDVIEMTDVVFPNPKENPARDPRVDIHVEDGRFFLLATDRKYDLITAEPPPPRNTGVVNLYTQEYFQLLYDRLAEGGIVSYWLPVYQLHLAETKAILKAFSNVFEHCSLWAGAGFDWVMIGMKNPARQASEEHFDRQWKDPVVGPEMRALGFAGPEQLGASFLADGAKIRTWTSGSLPLTDNYPQRLSYRRPSTIEGSDQYVKLRDPATARDAFMRSEEIEKIWPDALRGRTEKRFADIQIINEAFEMPPMTLERYVRDLHQCMKDPALRDYVQLMLGSDEFARRIVGEVLAEKKVGSPEAFLQTFYRSIAEAMRGQNFSAVSELLELCNHLAATAVSRGEYLVAENYYHLIGAVVEGFNKERTFYLRMYFLYLAGQKERASDVKSEYVAYISKWKSGGAERRAELERYWSWLAATFG
jgi:spermidine synthase